MSTPAGFPLNVLYEEDDVDGNVVLFRVLHHDWSRGMVAVIAVENARAMPVWRLLSDLEHGAADGTVRLRKDDPYMADTRSDQHLSNSAKRVRDARWKIVAPLVDPDCVPEGDATVDVLHEDLRGRLVSAAQVATGCALDKLYDWLRLYWRRGQTPNALLPDYDRCGGRGKERVPGTAKRGRPRKVLVADGGNTGLNVDREVLNGILKGARRFLYRKHKGRVYGVAEAYQATKENFFRQGVILKDRTLVPLLLPPEKSPTYDQFYYWAEKYRNAEESLIARYGERRFNLRHRMVLDSSESLSRGPGDLYLIDSTVGDIYLVSSLDRRRIVGRPVIYFVIDHWSRMIVGLYVALEGPNYMGAAMALQNAFTDKVSFCTKFGRDIEPEDWPCFHVCRGLTADRAELLSNASDDLVPGFKMRLSNTPPWRADFKAYVEAQFRLTNETGIKREPGWVDKVRGRGDGDYRLDAVLTIWEFTQLLIDLILLNNRSRGLKDQVPPDFPLSRDGDPVPLDLWEWGTEQGRNMGRVMDPERVRITLLPGYDAIASRHGLGIHNRLLCYDSKIARKAGWFLEGTGRESVKVTLKLDPRDISSGYLWLDGGREVERCELTPKYRRYIGHMLDEVLDERDRLTVGRRNSAGRRDQSRAEFNAHQQKRDENAAAARQEALGGSGVIPITAGIKEARRTERDAIRREEAFTRSDPRPEPLHDEDDDYIPFPS
jgi:putative transposase